MNFKRWWCLLSKNHSILNLGEFFHSEKYRIFTQWVKQNLLLCQGYDDHTWINKSFHNYKLSSFKMDGPGRDSGVLVWSDIDS